MDEFDRAVTIIKRLFFCGTLPLVKRQAFGSREAGAQGMKGLLDFCGVPYPLICFAESVPADEAPRMIVGIGLNIRCREEYRDELQTLLLTFNLTSIENLTFRLDQEGNVYAFTDVALEYRRPSRSEIEAVIRNLFAVASDYLEDIETAAADDVDSEYRQQILNKNYSYYRSFCDALPEEKQSLESARFISFPGYPFSDWINRHFESSHDLTGSADNE